MMAKTITGTMDTGKATGWPVSLTTGARRRGGLFAMGATPQGQNMTTLNTLTTIKRGSP